MVRIIIIRQVLAQDDPRMVPGGAVSERDQSENANCSSTATKAEHNFLQPSLRTLPDTQNQQNESAVAHLTLSYSLHSSSEYGRESLHVMKGIMESGWDS